MINVGERLQCGVLFAIVPGREVVLILVIASHLRLASQYQTQRLRTKHTLAVVLPPSSSMTLRILALLADVSRSAFTGTTISAGEVSAMDGAMMEYANERGFPYFMSGCFTLLVTAAVWLKYYTPISLTPSYYTITHLLLMQRRGIQAQKMAYHRFGHIISSVVCKLWKNFTNQPESKFLEFFLGT